jgi:hypothetical protein
MVHRAFVKYFLPGYSGTRDISPLLIFIGNIKDNLWSIDLLGCVSIFLRSHWVMVVMYVFIRRLIGFGVKRININGVSVFRMLIRAIALRHCRNISFPSTIRCFTFTVDSPSCVSLRLKRLVSSIYPVSH